MFLPQKDPLCKFVIKNYSIHGRIRFHNLPFIFTPKFFSWVLPRGNLRGWLQERTFSLPTAQLSLENVLRMAAGAWTCYTWLHVGNTWEHGSSVMNFFNSNLLKLIIQYKNTVIIYTYNNYMIRVSWKMWHQDTELSEHWSCYVSFAQFWLNCHNWMIDTIKQHLANKPQLKNYTLPSGTLISIISINSKYIVRNRIQTLDECETWISCYTFSSPLLATCAQVMFVHSLTFTSTFKNILYMQMNNKSKKQSSSSRQFYSSYSKGFLRRFLGSFALQQGLTFRVCIRTDVWCYTQ